MRPWWVYELAYVVVVAVLAAVVAGVVIAGCDILRGAA